MNTKTMYEIVEALVNKPFLREYSFASNDRYEVATLFLQSPELRGVSLFKENRHGEKLRVFFHNGRLIAEIKNVIFPAGIHTYILNDDILSSFQLNTEATDILNKYLPEYFYRKGERNESGSKATNCSYTSRTCNSNMGYQPRQAGRGIRR